LVDKDLAVLRTRKALEILEPEGSGALLADCEERKANDYSLRPNSQPLRA
jgi:hypothetical protein